MRTTNGFTYEEARAYMAKARDKAAGRPLQNNTRMYERERRTDDASGDRVPVYAIELHNTDIVTILPGDEYELSTGGWYTVTTKDRICGWSPARPYGANDDAKDGAAWWLETRPKENDPKPPYPQPEIPAVFHASDPGPEPVKSNDGCIAGHLHVRPVRETVSVVDESELHHSDIPKVYGNPLDAPTPARRCLAWIDELDHGKYSIRYTIERWALERIEYGDARYAYGADRMKPTWKYVQCPHCAAHDRLHANWRYLLSGNDCYATIDRGRNYRGYTTYTRMMERFGTTEAWREAYLDDFRRVRTGRREHRWWVERNRIPFRNGICVDHEGYPIMERRDLEYVAATIAEQDRERAHIEFKDQRRKAKARLRRRAENDIRVIGRKAAADLRNIANASALGGRTQ